MCYRRGEKKDESQEGHPTPSWVFREGCLEEATTKERTDRWNKLAGKGVQRPKRASPINSERLQWRERGRAIRVSGAGSGGVDGRVPGDLGRNNAEMVLRGSSIILGQ